MLHKSERRLTRPSILLSTPLIGLCYDVWWPRTVRVALLHPIVRLARTIVRRWCFVGYIFVVPGLMTRGRKALAVARWRWLVPALIKGCLLRILHVRRTLINVSKLSWGMRSVRDWSWASIDMPRLCRARWRVEGPSCAIAGVRW